MEEDEEGERKGGGGGGRLDSCKRHRKYQIDSVMEGN